RQRSVHQGHWCNRGAIVLQNLETARRVPKFQRCIHGAARFEIDLLPHLRRWIRLLRFTEDGERISDLSRLDLKACKLQERGGKGRRHRCCTPNLLELSHRFFATTCP